MTQEEAQQLIAQVQDINTSVDKQYFLSLTKDIEKIITRFANKPPKEGYTQRINFQNDDDLMGFVTIKPYEYEKNKYVDIHLSRDGKTLELTLNSLELKQLRDNINKMLEWLDEQAI